MGHQEFRYQGDQWAQYPRPKKELEADLSKTDFRKALTQSEREILQQRKEEAERKIVREIDQFLSTPLTRPVEKESIARLAQPLLSFSQDGELEMSSKASSLPKLGLSGRDLEDMPTPLIPDGHLYHEYHEPINGEDLED